MDRHLGTGTTVTDLEGSNNLTLINGPTFNSSANGSIDFDGPSDYAETESNIGISSNNSRTFEGWFYIDAEIDRTERGLGLRSSRYTMLIENGVATKIKAESDAGTCEISAAENFLKEI